MTDTTIPSPRVTGIAAADTMRAVEYDRYGGPEVLCVRRVPRPRPGPREVLIRVHAAAVNPADVKIRAGQMKLVSRRRFPKRSGLDFTGEITAVGGKVTDAAIGQRVWGFLADPTGRTGSLADYITAGTDTFSPAPAALNLRQAAALPSVGVTALRALHAILKVRAGHRLLIVGAAGGVGSTAIQLAAATGVTVTALAGPANHELCRALGATHVADYTDPTTLTGPFDAVLDCHGSHLPTYRRLLHRRGRILSLSPTALGPAALSLLTLGPRIRLTAIRPRRADLITLADHVDTGELHPIVDAAHPLDDIATAHRALETGHARGKIVITVRPNDDRDPRTTHKAGDAPRSAS
ncbi:NAD(P)-dependent alcohol dehydrogenase [Nocardia blacklockiae]|uniref:NAD(P)-dependent alcohol dehydrogenase n=1 Tax=Nocardia blacklockiae TaxID=480036 RepID=UPI001893DAE8|nr:NAD(P)-dependent alcohol dehydrogenase [Nocardia blacklockiae]MBF6175023.1 NAD(P)-dependent alcohol dehydrogenase [Nocardia blacklockiae]